jgi:hypothetical protein
MKDANATELLERMFRRGERAGVCRIYFLDEDVTCPLCGADVPRRTLHECAVGAAPNTGEVGGKDMQEPILQFFKWEHLPPPLQLVSQPFGQLATTLVDTLPRNPERTVALRKLLEAKDAAVRAALFQEV